MKCPKCKGELEAIHVQDVALDRCSVCGGMWFEDLDAAELQTVRGQVAQPAGVEEPPLACPKGHGAMAIIRVVEHPRIIYSQCATCKGAFMDAAEFRDFGNETFVDFVRDFFVDEE